MKKILALLMALCMVFALAACGQQAAPAPTEAPAAPVEQPTEAPVEQPTEEPVEVPVEQPVEEAPTAMSYEEFAAAELDTQVTVEAYVQAKQAYSESYGNTSLYLQDEDGAYFVYRIACTAEEYEALAIGQKVRITGFKSEWSGEVEITDAAFELLDGSFQAEAKNLSAMLGTDALIDYQNQFVSFKGLTVAEIGEGEAFLYNWDGSGEDGSDLYFNVAAGDQVFNFCIESDLCGAGTEVYEAVKALNVGDEIDLEGFLYWYNGANPHITAVTAAPVMNAEAFAAAELDTEVTIESYIQGKQIYNESYENTSLYLQDEEGAYFVYRIPCTAEDYEALAIGQKVRVTGFKAEWSGEVEISDARFELVAGSYEAEPTDVTALLGTDGLIEQMNKLVSFQGMTVEAIGEGEAFLYNWDGSGEEGSDLYFNVSLNGVTYNFCVESDLCGPGSEVYEAVKALQVGDTVDLVGFLYWYNGANPHITAVTVK